MLSVLSWLTEPTLLCSLSCQNPETKIISISSGSFCQLEYDLFFVLLKGDQFLKKFVVLVYCVRAYAAYSALPCPKTKRPLDES